MSNTVVLYEVEEPGWQRYQTRAKFDEVITDAEQLMSAPCPKCRKHGYPRPLLDIYNAPQSFKDRLKPFVYCKKRSAEYTRLLELDDDERFVIAKLTPEELSQLKEILPDVPPATLHGGPRFGPLRGRLRVSKFKREIQWFTTESLGLVFRRDLAERLCAIAGNEAVMVELDLLGSEQRRDYVEVAVPFNFEIAGREERACSFCGLPDLTGGIDVHNKVVRGPHYIGWWEDTNFLLCTDALLTEFPDFDQIAELSPGPKWVGPPPASPERTDQR